MAYFNGGRFEQTSPGVWKEYGRSGGPRFTFRETQRDEWSVYLRDDSRNGDLQIDVHRNMISAGWDGRPRSDLYPVTKFQRTSARAPRPTPTPNREQTCYNLIQGKVAWRQGGSKNWSDANVRNLCAGTSNPTATRDCFRRGINIGKGWSEATNSCKSNTNSFRQVSAPTPAPRPTPTPRPTQGSGGKVTLYQHCNYAGYGVSLPAGSYSLSALQSKGIKNDDVSSIRVSPGYKVEIYEDAGYRGARRTLEGNTSCLTSYGMNDKLSSIKVLPRSSSGTTRSTPTPRVQTSTPRRQPASNQRNPNGSGNMACVCTDNACGSGAVAGNQGDSFSHISSAKVRSDFTPNSNTGWSCAIPSDIKTSSGSLGCFCSGYCGNGGTGADPKTYRLGNISQERIDQRYGGGKKGNKTGWLCGKYRGRY